jgi:hypothetical protein
MSTTALLLNWKRPDNIPLTIKSIRDQSADIKIWLWNNNPADTAQYDVDYQINSPNNFKCWPRWLLGSMVTTKYIFTLDDDLQIAKPDHISNCIRYIETKPADTILGYTGVILQQNKSYWQSPHITSPDAKRDIQVDIVKGRFMFMRASILGKVMLENEPQDDIKISSYSKHKFIPAMFHGSLRDLPEGTVSLFKQPGHSDKRVTAAKKYFPEKYTTK